MTNLVSNNEKVSEEKEAEEKEAYKRKIWKSRQKKERNPLVKRMRKKYQRKNRAKLRTQAKRRYKKNRINPAFKRQRKIQQGQKDKRKRLASSLTIKVAMSYLQQKRAKLFVDPKDLPDQIQKILKSLKIRSSVEVETTRQFNPSRAGAYGEGYQGFAIIVNLDTGQTKKIESGWGMPIPDQKAQAIPPNGAVIVGSRGGSSRKLTVSAILIHPDNMGKVFQKSDLKLSIEEQKTLNILGSYNSRGRKEEFPEVGLGVYGKDNQYIKRLSELGLVTIKGRGVSLTTNGKNMKKPYTRSWEDLARR